MEGKWLFYGILGSIVLATNAWALVPDRTATITVHVEGFAGCKNIATARVNRSYTNGAVEDMGLSGVVITTQVYENDGLTEDPPHNGSGDGVAEVAITVTCHLSTDENGILSEDTQVVVQRPTTPCTSHNDDDEPED